MKKTLLNFKSWAIGKSIEVEPFRSKDIKKALDQQQLINFDSEFVQLCRSFMAFFDIEHERPDNETIKETLESISGHISRLNDALGDGANFLSILGEVAEHPNENTALLKFYEAAAELQTVKLLCEKAIIKKSYAQKMTKAELPKSIAAETGRLLNKYRVKCVLTTGGVWDRLFKHTLDNLGIKATIHQRKNYMKAGVKIQKKKE
jgi:hypothetical protein